MFHVYALYESTLTLTRTLRFVVDPKPVLQATRCRSKQWVHYT